jgi:hypothetical protein
MLRKDIENTKRKGGKGGRFVKVGTIVFAGCEHLRIVAAAAAMTDSRFCVPFANWLPVNLENLAQIPP